MRLLAFLFRNSKLTVILIMIAGVVSGLSNTAILAMLNESVAAGVAPATSLSWQFAGLCVTMMLAGVISQILSVRLSQKTIYDLRQQLIAQILSAPLRQLEEIGAARLLVLLTEDVYMLTQAIAIGPLLCINVVLLLALAGYLMWLAPLVLLTLVAVMVIGILVVFVPFHRASLVLQRARERQDTLFGYFRSLTEGTKELKIHRARRHAFVSEGIQPTAKALMDDSIIGMSALFMAAQWATTLFFIFIGILFFVLPSLLGLDFRALTGTLLVVFYLVTPLTVIMGTMPVFSQSNVILEKVKSLGFAPIEIRPQEALPSEPVSLHDWQRIELAGVTHAYYREREAETFTLGPIDLAFVPGELVFLVGGNGSGKTTLAKLITGLYTPETGEIRLNGKPIDDASREDYRQLFSVVFSDFYLFESLLGLNHGALDAKAREYLIQFQLDYKVKIEAGVLSTLDLSQGQRKRLALLTAYLEDRPFYLFDEWAADQDPLFKEIFYCQLLPDLKRRGKTVLVITHDDKYFHLADRLIRLDYGRVAESMLVDEPAYS
jgi:putative ATP-binding cassette transporter